jgi:FkbM family methyltransferase
MDKLYIKKLLNNIENPTILEIGCNDGQDTIEFIDTFSELKIYCFEPDQRAYDQFVNKVCSDKCNIYNIALSNVDGEIDFHMSDSNQKDLYTPRSVGDNWNKSGSIKKPKKHKEVHPWCKFDKVVKVKTLKLDTWISDKNIDKIDFVWMDVQGAEEEVINGGLEAFNNKVKYLYTEYSQIELYEGNSSIEKITSLLSDFNLIKIMDNDILLKNRNF